MNIPISASCHVNWAVVGLARLEASCDANKREASMEVMLGTLPYSPVIASSADGTITILVPGS